MSEEINQEKLKATVIRCQNQLEKFPRIKEYLNKRMISDEMIKEFELGYGEFYERRYLTIPIKDIDNNYLFIKLRRDPNDTVNQNKFKTFPVGVEGTIYGMEQLVNNETIIIVEGEMDCIILQSQGVPAISSTTGSQGWKKEWMFVFQKCKKVFICFDSDEAGQKGAEKLGQMILDEYPTINVFKINLPEIAGGGKDITDLAIVNNGIINIDALLYDWSTPIKLSPKINEQRAIVRREFNGDSISQEDIERASKVDCSKFVKIERRSGNVFFAKCPFHDEDTPSFACYSEGRGCYCFGCDFGNDAIGLVMKLYKLDFKEAVKLCLST